jgi:seryl-tRNA synthetase
MVGTKKKVESQIKELEEMKKHLKKECDKVLAKHNKIVKELQSGEANAEKVITKTLSAVADALLVNLMQNEFNVKNLLGSDESVGLEAILVPLKSLVTPPHEQLVYSRARE